jgi:hypothetical protein
VQPGGEFVTVVAQYAEEVDDVTVSVVEDFDVALWFVDQHSGTPRKRFDVAVMRRKVVDDPRR